MIPTETSECIWEHGTGESPLWVTHTWIQRVVIFLEEMDPAELPSDLTSHMHAAALVHDWESIRRLVRLADLRDRTKKWTHA